MYIERLPDESIAEVAEPETKTDTKEDLIDRLGSKYEIARCKVAKDEGE